VATSWHPAAVASPCNPRHHRLGHLLDQRHQIGAGGQQRPHVRQVGAGHVGEVMPGAEHRAAARQHDAQRIAVPQVAERRDQLAHVLDRQGVCGAAAGSS